MPAAKRKPRSAKKPAAHGGTRRGAGRPRKFRSSNTVANGLHLPQPFWDFLDALDGSRSTAFVQALQDDRMIDRMRKLLA